MNRAKKLTRREKKEANAQLRDQPKAARKPRKQKAMLSLTLYLQRQTARKQEKKHHRQEKRDAKAGKIHTH